MPRTSSLLVLVAVAAVFAAPAAAFRRHKAADIKANIKKMMPETPTIPSPATHTQPVVTFTASNKTPTARLVIPRGDGLNEEDFTVRREGNYLLVSGQRQARHGETQSQAQFTNSFFLPVWVDYDAGEMHLDEGRDAFVYVFPRLPEHQLAAE